MSEVTPARLGPPHRQRSRERKAPLVSVPRVGFFLVFFWGFFPEVGVVFGSRRPSCHDIQADASRWMGSPGDEGTNFSSARGCGHRQLLQGAAGILLENPFGIAARLLPPRARIHPLIQGSVSRVLSQPVTLLKTIHLLFKPWNGL